MKPALLTAVLLAALCPAAAPGQSPDQSPDQSSDQSPGAFPRLQVVPLPYDQAAIEDRGQPLTVYHFGAALHRPFLFPIHGPSGRRLTRMGHPHDPVGHSHHNSLWVSHHDVDGVDYWSDRGGGKIRHQRILQYRDGADEASILTQNHWVDAQGRVQLHETRRMAVRPLADGQWLLVLDLQLVPPAGQVTLGKTPFGLVGLRMAKTIGVRDGGGLIRNSAGGHNEKGVFWKPAAWVDYSGHILPDRQEGITLLDHPDNPNHPTVFHVRDDGWLGPSLTFAGPRTITAEEPLRLRYGFYIHAGVPAPEDLQKQWRAFAQLPLEELKPQP